MADYNCKELCWQECNTQGGEESWGNTLLNPVMSNTTTHWTGENTSFTLREEPSRLDLLFTQEPDTIGEITYQCTLGKSDHILMEFKLSDGIIEARRASYRNGRCNYGKAGVDKLRKHFDEIDWEHLYTAKTHSKMGCIHQQV